MRENHLYYFEICDETIKMKSKSKHLNSNTHKHRKKYGIVVEEYEIFEPKIVEVNYIFDDVVKNCRDNFLRTFEYRCMYDIKFTNMVND